MNEREAPGQSLWPDSWLLRQRHRAWNGGEGHACPERAGGGESWAAAAAADLGGGGHADLRDKRVIKQAEDLFLLDFLGWGVFGRRRDWWAFPELWVGRG